MGICVNVGRDLLRSLQLIGRQLTINQWWANFNESETYKISTEGF